LLVDPVKDDHLVVFAKPGHIIKCRRREADVIHNETNSNGSAGSRSVEQVRQVDSDYNDYVAMAQPLHLGSVHPLPFGCIHSLSLRLNVELWLAGRRSQSGWGAVACSILKDALDLRAVCVHASGVLQSAGDVRHRNGFVSTCQRKETAMVNAVILMNVKRDSIRSTAESLADLPGVSEVYSVGGRYDLVAMIRVANNDELAELVTERIRRFEAILSTETLIAYRAFSRHDLD